MTVGQPGQGWRVVLRRWAAGILDGRPEGGYTGVFEIICRDRGDHRAWITARSHPGLQLLRGPYPLTVGVAAYEQHIEWHQWSATETGDDRTPAGSSRQ